MQPPRVSMEPGEIVPYYMERIAQTVQLFLQANDPVTLLVKLPDDFIVDGNLHEVWRDEFNVGVKQLIQMQTGCIMFPDSTYVDLHILYRVAMRGNT